MRPRCSEVLRLLSPGNFAEDGVVFGNNIINGGTGTPAGHRKIIVDMGCHYICSKYAYIYTTCVHFFGCSEVLTW